MSSTDSYSFFVKKDKVGWLLSASCYTDLDVAPVALESQPISKAEMQRIRRHQEPASNGVEVLDGAVYRTTIGFADGKSISAPLEPSASLKKAFYQLAEKYENLPNNGEKDE